MLKPRGYYTMVPHKGFRRVGPWYIGVGVMDTYYIVSYKGCC